VDSLDSKCLVQFGLVISNVEFQLRGACLFGEEKQFVYIILAYTRDMISIGYYKGH